MGLGPIPSSKIRKRAAVLCDDEEAAERFFILIRRMDDEYVSEANSPKKKPDPKVRAEVAPDDTAGVKRLFDRLGAQQTDGKRKPSLKKKQP